MPIGLPACLRTILLSDAFRFLALCTLHSAFTQIGGYLVCWQGTLSCLRVSYAGLRDIEGWMGC